VGKRAFDIVAALVAVPFALLTCVVMGAILALELRGNPIFVQERIGKEGKPFRLYKLRTMRHPRPGELTPYIVDDWSTYVFSPSGVKEPRLTRWGAFARKTSLDELPNLINVLKGDMSIVGPRPEIPELVAQYPAEYHRRHAVKPGITDWHRLRPFGFDLRRSHFLRSRIRGLAFGRRRPPHPLETVAVVLTGSGAR
jgi:lipopolysaccharide/colanic/teichoic acid biosynthesis glycosyltransferase